MRMTPAEGWNGRNVDLKYLTERKVFGNRSREAWQEIHV